MFLPLNPAQEAAAESIEGNVVVVAGPGTGKTAVAVQRHLLMISKHNIKASDILNLTFTREAATQMVERVGLFEAEKVFRTFHSYALDLMQRERAHVPFEMCDTIIPVYGEEYKLIRELMRVYPACTNFRKLRDMIAEWKAGGVDPDTAIRENYSRGLDFYYAHAYRDYEIKCREQGWLDFDSLMKEAVKLLETNDEVRARNKRKYILVDEAQDTDTTQFRLLQLIYDGNILVVGDENQLIYEWRSAQAGNLSGFSRVFPGAKTLYLGQNYRSTQRLVAFFKRILPVDNGIASYMASMREEGVDPTFTRYDDDLQEASVVLTKITDPANTAVIARTNRQVLTFQRAALGRGIRSRVLGRKNLWELNEVKHLLKLVKDDASGRPAYTVLIEKMLQNNLTHLYQNTNNVNEKSPAENMDAIIKLSAKRGTVPEFLAWLNKLTHVQRKKVKDAELTVTTVHQAKGREWKHVFVIGAKEGQMPHRDGELLEEHRIFYVACTRAADTLEISWYGQHSQFLNEIQKEFKDYEQQIDTETDSLPEGPA